MRFPRSFSLLCLASILIAACAPAVSTASPGEVETIVAVTFAAMTASAPTSAPEVLPLIVTVTPEPQLTPDKQFANTHFIQTTAQNVNLRVGPGRLFQVRGVLAQGTSLEVVGIARGGEWLYVVNQEGIFGWVSVLFVAGGFDGPPPSLVEPENVQLVTGTVHTELGTPVNGIGFALEQGTNRTDAATDDEGRFYAYLPSNLSGTWRVSYVSVSCRSNTMDSNCNCISGTCGGAFPVSVDVTLLSSSDLVFVWK